jgi:non-heme chloroperoxidase
MPILVIVLGLVVVGVVLLHQAAQSVSAKIKSSPDLYPYERLAKEPHGEEAYITRPDGTRIRAISGGAGPTVVLAHGYGMGLLAWNIVWDLLIAAGYRVIAFDLRGHTKSTIGSDGINSQVMSDDYAAVLEHYDVRDGILVGHSTGGFLSGVFQLNHPDVAAQRLKGAVYVSATLGRIYEGSPQTRLQIPLIQSGLMNHIVQSEVYGSAFGASLFGEVAPPAAIRVFNEAFLSQQHAPMVPILQALADEDDYPRLSEIKTPTVVVCGRADKTTPPWHSEALGKGIANARNIWVDGKGHALNWEAPEVLVQAIQSLK